ncbi:MAG: hypothetical protein JXB33_06230 [Clostridia bacterium]|nr:hypothetical protein [Clostridia bacterium]
MKKIVIPVVVFFVVIIASIIFAVSDSYTRVQYGKDTMFHRMTLDEGGTLEAEYDDVTTLVAGRNLQRIYSSLTVSEMKRIYKKPSWDPDTAIYLRFSDGAQYIIAEDPSVIDGVFILYTYKKENIRFTLSGYKTFDWIKRAIAPDGIYNDNPIIE